MRWLAWWTRREHGMLFTLIIARLSTLSPVSSLEKGCSVACLSGQWVHCKLSELPCLKSRWTVAQNPVGSHLLVVYTRSWYLNSIQKICLHVKGHKHSKLHEWDHYQQSRKVIFPFYSSKAWHIWSVVFSSGFTSTKKDMDLLQRIIIKMAKGVEHLTYEKRLRAGAVQHKYLHYFTDYTRLLAWC